MKSLMQKIKEADAVYGELVQRFQAIELRKVALKAQLDLLENRQITITKKMEILRDEIVIMCEKQKEYDAMASATGAEV